MKEEKSKETSKVSKTVSTIWKKYLKPFLEGLWFFLKIILVVSIFGLYLYIFSEFVIEGIRDFSAIHLAAGIGGYMVVGIVALLVMYQILFHDDFRKHLTNLITNSQRHLANLITNSHEVELRAFSLGRDLDSTDGQINSLKHNMDISELGWKIDDLHRDVKDLKRSLEK